MAMSIQSASDEELESYLYKITEEINRRRTVRHAESQITEISTAVLKSEGIQHGDPWRQPTGAHDSYPKNWIVSHNGKRWDSLICGNVYEPGVSGWRELTSGDTPPEWIQPTGGHDAYSIGDKVTFEGEIYESLIDGNVWSPTDYPAGWNKLS